MLVNYSSKMRLLVLSSKTGGGHEIRAQAIQEFCHSLRIESSILRPLEDSAAIYLLGTNIYNWIQRFYPRLHSLYFRLLEYASLHSNPKLIIGGNEFQNKISKFYPSTVISVHAHLNHGFLDLIRNAMPRHSVPNFMIYCGELADGVGYSRHWINPKADLFCGPTKSTINAAIKRGMPSNKCKVLGPLLRQPFYREETTPIKNDFCKKHRLDPNIPIALLATGANGVNSHEMALKAVAYSKKRMQVVVLCGRSRQLYKRVKMLSHKYEFPIKALAQIDAQEMSRLINLSLWVFGRPGAGLTSEVVSSGTNMIFDVSGGIMPQEYNNLNFFKNKGQSPRVAKNTKTLCKHICNDFTMPPPKMEMQPEVIKETILKLVKNDGSRD